MKFSLEARRLAKYKKKKEISVATFQFDVTFCTPILCAPSKRLGPDFSRFGNNDISFRVRNRMLDNFFSDSHMFFLLFFFSMFL